MLRGGELGRSVLTVGVEDESNEALEDFPRLLWSGFRELVHGHLDFQIAEAHEDLVIGKLRPHVGGAGSLLRLHCGAARGQQAQRE